MYLFIFVQKGSVKILYGTQTGTAETFARRLGKEATQYQIYAKVMDMEDYDPVCMGGGVRRWNRGQR